MMKKVSRHYGLALLLPLFAIGGGAVLAQGGDAAAGHREKARALAEKSGFKSTFDLQCRTDPNRPRLSQTKDAPPPTKLFDNLYYVGLNSVGAYAVKTSAGIILLDSLNSSEDAQTVIVPGLKAMGLDPKTIKYVLISHAHGDHYGGAKWLAETYGGRVIASAADWDVMENPRPRAPGDGPVPNWSAPPKRDIVATDGQKLKLGDTTVTLVLTPGHTPGTLSFIVPVKDHGRPHMLAMWGGTSIPVDAAIHRQYMASFDHFETFTKPMKVDVELSNHPFVDDSLNRMATLRANPGNPNPFVIGQARYAAYTGVLKECAMAMPISAPTAGPMPGPMPAPIPGGAARP